MALLLPCSALFSSLGWRRACHTFMELDLRVWLHRSHGTLSERDMLSPAKFWCVQHHALVCQARHQSVPDSLRTATNSSEVSLALASHSTQYAGGLYFFSSMLSGRHGPVAGWFTGYMNVFGQVNLFCDSLKIDSWHGCNKYNKQSVGYQGSLAQMKGVLSSVTFCSSNPGKFLIQVAFVAGTEYTTIQLISVTVALSTQMTQGHAYELSPAMVMPCMPHQKMPLPVSFVKAGMRSFLIWIASAQI